MVEGRLRHCPAFILAFRITLILQLYILETNSHPTGDGGSEGCDRDETEKLGTTAVWVPARLQRECSDYVRAVRSPFHRFGWRGNRLFDGERPPCTTAASNGCDRPAALP